jgi:hypothetical protein
LSAFSDRLFIVVCSWYLCPIDNLIRDNEVLWLDFLSQASDSRKRDDSLNPDIFESSDIGTARDMGGRESVVGSVPSEKSNGMARREDSDGDGG